MAFTDRLHNRGSISTGYDIENSLKFESDNAEYLMAEGRSQGNQQTWTFSIWLKRTEVDNGSVAQYIFSAGSDGKLGIYFRDDASYPDDRIFIYLDEGNSQKWIGQVNQSFRDTAAWYHLVFSCDTTDSTATDRTKLYINGERQTITYNDTMNVNTSTRVGDNGGKFALGARIATPGYNFNGYMAEAVLVDGSALTPTSFGEYDDDSGIWKPKDVSSLSLGTTGFHMNFDDSSNVGAVQRGNNGGNFDKYNLSAADQATDTPTNNFATMNPLHYTTKYTITEGGTRQNSSVNGWGTSVGSIGVSSGKWYFEIKSPDNNGYTTFGAIDLDSVIDTYVNGDAHAGDAPYGISHYGGNGSIIINGSAVSGTSFPTWNTQIMGCALDLDNNKIYFSKDGTYGNSGNPVTGANGISLPSGGSGTWFFSTSTYVQPLATNQGGLTTISISSAASDANGYGTFEYAPPSGYYALCSKNLAEYG